MKLGKPQLRAKLEVASFSCRTNIKGEPQNFGGAPLAQGHKHFFFGVGFDDGPWQTPAASQI